MTSPQPFPRIGLLGGTFNPVHVGHLRLAIEVAEQLHLEMVELMPCAVPPHKANTGLLPFDLRVELLRAAVEGTPSLTVSTLEAELPAPSYTWNLVQAWSQSHGRIPLFIVGDEDFAGLHDWFCGPQLPTRTDFAVVSRSETGTALFLEGVSHLAPNACPQPVQGFPGRLEVCLAPGRTCTFISLPRLDISASAVRKHWGKGDNIRFLVPDATVALMIQHQKILRHCWHPQV